jgi:outer membrane protein assembly factor BamB
MTSFPSVFVYRSSTQIVKNFRSNTSIQMAPSRAPVARKWASLILVSLVAVISLGACSPDLGSSIHGWSPVVAGDGVAYVATQQGQLKALIDDGSGAVSVKWTFPEGDENLGGVFNTPVVGADLIYVAAVDGTLYAIDKETGAIGPDGWTSSLVADANNEHLVSGPVFNAEENILLVGSEDQYLYAIDAASGGEKWKFMAEDKIWSTPVIANGTVYFGSHDRNIYAVDLATGDLKWQFTTGGAVVARPLVWQDMVLVGGFDRKLYALDAQQGTELWNFAGAGNWIWAGAVAGDSFVFAPAMDGHVYALDRAGMLQWDYDAGSPLVADPVIVPRGLVVATREGDVSLIDITDGTLINQYSDIKPAEILAPLFTPPPVNDARSPAAGGGNQQESVFVGTQNGTVYRIQARSGLIKVWCFDTKEDRSCS